MGMGNYPERRCEEVTMQCLICKHGETVNGHTTVTLERGNMTLVYKNVPAAICANCGEEFVNDQTTDQLLRISEQAAQKGVQVDIRQYSPNW